MRPNFNYIKSEFGEIDNKYSNIIFVNGGMDPWLPGCVNEQKFANLPVLTIKNAAHHLDSFLPRNDDSQSLKNVR